MLTFEKALKDTSEIGIVSQVIHVLALVTGIPNARIDEIVIFDNGEMGQVIAINQHAEILMLGRGEVKVDSKVARTGKFLDVAVGPELLGKVIDPLGNSLYEPFTIANPVYHPIERTPDKILNRDLIREPLVTGVPIVDLVVPLGRGQRELLVGDQKTGKTAFLLQTVANQASHGNICVYSAIGKKKTSIRRFAKRFKDWGVDKNVVMVASGSSDSPGLIFINPYVAMTIAEYFRDQGRDVVLILDDLSTHAKYYREISLLGKRFPGRNSYPGDIFYVHSRLLERAGKFVKGSITVLPVVDTVLGDLSGFIQTNIMSMTDGHLYFDTEYSNLGRHPAVNPFLSVTRVGFQTQTGLTRDVSRKLSAFLVEIEKLRQFLHFGAELSEETLKTIATGERLIAFFNQPTEVVIPLNVSVFVVAAIMGGIWRDAEISVMKAIIDTFRSEYIKSDAFKLKVDTFISKSADLDHLILNIRDNATDFNLQ
jgi:F-type H+/Na+-transporting ATPase subunit alpha